MASIKYFGLVDNPFDFGIGRTSALERVHTSRTEIVLENPITFAKLTLTGRNLDFAPDGTLTGQADQLSIETEAGLKVLELSYYYDEKKSAADVLAGLETYRRTGELTPLITSANTTTYGTSFSASESDRPVTISFEGIGVGLSYSASAHGDKITAGSASYYDFSGGAGSDTMIGGSGRMHVRASTGDVVIPGTGAGAVDGSGEGLSVLFPENFQGNFSYRHARSFEADPQEIVYRLDAVTGEAKSLVDGKLSATFVNGAEAYVNGRFSLYAGYDPAHYEVNLGAEDHMFYSMGRDIAHYAFTGHGTVTLMVIEHIPMKFYGSSSSTYIDIDVPAGRYHIYDRFEGMNETAITDPHSFTVSDTTTLEVIGTNNSDRFIGGAEDDIFHPFLGNDTIDGGAGYDTLKYTSANFRYPLDPHSYFITSSPPDLVVNLNTGIATSRKGNVPYKQTLANIEAVFGSPMEDVLIGTGLGNHLGGEGSNDRLFAGMPTAADFPDQANQVFRLYQAMLGRAPDTAGHIDWVSKILIGQETAKSAAVGFMGSQEFRQKYGGLENEAFVELLYKNVLGRAADAGGKAHWLKLLDQGTPRSEVTLGFADSPEFIRTTNKAATDFAAARDPGRYVDDIYRLYQATLDREPNASGFQDWLGELTSGMPLEQAARIFIGSPEFLQKYGDLNDGAFVDQLYENVLDRPASPAGLADWVARLQSGASRESVVLGFAQSQEFTTKTTTPFVEWMRLMDGDTLEGGAGNDQLYGGTMTDTFVFKLADKGRDIVKGIDAWDVLSFDGFGFENLGDLRSQFTQQGNAVVFADQGVEVVIENFRLSALTDEMLSF